MHEMSTSVVSSLPVYGIVYFLVFDAQPNYIDSWKLKF